MKKSAHTINVPALAATLVAAFTLAGTGAAQALSINDVAGDFLPTFVPVGPNNNDLDVLFTSGNLIGTTLTLSATVNAPIGTTASATYIFGLNRGAGTARFAALGVNNILFDSVVVANPDGSGLVNLLNGTTIPLTLGAVSIAGNSISVQVDTSLLPSLGFATQDYTYNLWPRTGQGNNNQIADFAPDNGMLAVVPEPSTYGIVMGLGAAFIALSARRKRRLTAAA